MFKRRPKVLVTGSCGYIGSHCARLLTARGYEVVGLDNLSRGWRQSFQDRLWEVDLRDAQAVERVLQKEKPQVVMHFAGLVSVEESVAHPQLYFDVNSWGALNLVEAMLKARVPLLIFSSSALVYGEPQELPLMETHRRWPTSPYGGSKKCAEDLIEHYAAISGLRFAGLRYFNVAGWDFLPPDGAAVGDTHLLPRVLEVAAGRQPMLEVYGDDYPTRDGTCVRDYVHVMDVCSAHILLLESLLQGHPGGFFNVGSGQGYTVKEVVQTARQVTGCPVPIAIRDRRPGDVAALVASTERLCRLGWRPQCQSLDMIVASAWRWFSHTDPAPASVIDESRKSAPLVWQ